MANRTDAPADLSFTPHHPDYPSALLDLADPPATLFVRGWWPIEPPAVAMVGSRAASDYGRQFAERLSGELARLGHTVVSGLAHGIDAASHRGALSAGGRTVAVLPGSLDQIVPRAHHRLAREIATRGALVSEQPAGALVHKGTFVERNRLIAALARVVIVVEAAETSGALHTAAAARRLGRPLLAVPGDVDRPTSRGCHALLRSGARLCEGAADVIEALAAAGTVLPLATNPPAVETKRPTKVAATEPPTALSAPQSRVLHALGSRRRTVEECADVAGLDVARTLHELLRLEWAGLAQAEPGGRWCRRRPR